MKKYVFPFLLLVFLLSAFPFLDQDGRDQALTGLPWQIDIQPDGSTRVFGLHIGNTRLSEAVEALGDDMELAIIAAPGETGNLEMYFGHYRAGLLSGKLVLQTGAGEQLIRRWRENAKKSEPMPSGNARKYVLSQGDLVDAMKQTVAGVTFIPSVNLDEDIILKRFGAPHERVRIDGAEHYRYPDKGLDIALHEDAKEVLQYVAPKNFSLLVDQVR